jgi:hypothetical protein
MDGFPWAYFPLFVGNSASRFETLRRVVADMGLAEPEDRHIVNIGDCRHFLISAEKQHVRRKSPVVLLSHYDAVPGSPGANDNGAAVFMLLALAAELRRNGAQDWLVILSDKEEVPEAGGISQQGAYLLASCLSRTALADSPFFILDSLGRGDTIVISTTADMMLRGMESRAARNRAHSMQTLRGRALRSAAKAGIDRTLLFPTPFSDDAGFLLAGLAAQTITALPHAEAQRALAATRRRTLSTRLNGEATLPFLETAHTDRPYTWQLMNSSEDKISTLTPENFPRIIRFLSLLCNG